MRNDVEVKQSWNCDSCGAFEEDKYAAEICRNGTIAVSDLPKNWDELFIYSTHFPGQKAILCSKCSRILHQHKGETFKSLLATISQLFKG